METVIMGFIGITENTMEATIVGFIGRMENRNGNYYNGLCWGYMRVLSRPGVGLQLHQTTVGSSSVCAILFVSARKAVFTHYLSMESGRLSE